ncbi:MAG TPA: hypothetical protein VMZ04_09900 [Anaerolineae bacterium]|nr:hypothetical protein [Anaerolineae bacterium]
MNERCCSGWHFLSVLNGRSLCCIRAVRSGVRVENVIKCEQE